MQGCGIARLPDVIQLGESHTNYPACPTWDVRWRRGIEVDDPDVAVVLLDRWELMDRKLDGVYRHVGQPEYDEYLLSELDLAVSIVAARGAQVVLLTAPYTHRAERPDGGLYDEDLPERVDAWNHLLREMAERNPEQITILDLNARVCPDGTFTWNIGRLRIRSDGLHFTPEGVRQWIAPWLMPQLSAIATGNIVCHQTRRLSRRAGQRAVRWPVSLTLRTATPPSGQVSTMEIPAGSRKSRCRRASPAASASRRVSLSGVT